MRTLLVALLLLAAPGAATAGPALALRLGYALSSGDAARGTPMSDVAKSEIPIQLDALWRFGPHFSAGGYFSYGFGQLSKDVSDRCDSLGASCSVWTMRLGAEAQYAFTDLSPRFAPWIGMGMGWEWAHERVSLGSQSARQDVSGWELVNLEGGADVKVATRVVLGPYVSLRVAQYSRLDGHAVVSKAWHNWLGFGVRGTWDP